MTHASETHTWCTVLAPPQASQANCTEQSQSVLALITSDWWSVTSLSQHFRPDTVKHRLLGSRDVAGGRCRPQRGRLRLWPFQRLFSKPSFLIAQHHVVRICSAAREHQTALRSEPQTPARGESRQQLATLSGR